MQNKLHAKQDRIPYRRHVDAEAVVPNLGPPDVLELQLPETFTTTSAGQDFWELKSKNIWRPKVGDHCWNSLSQEVRVAPSLLSFCKQAKTFLFRQAFP